MSDTIHVHYSCKHQATPNVAFVDEDVQITIKWECPSCKKGKSTELIIFNKSVDATPKCPRKCKCREGILTIPLDLLLNRNQPSVGGN